MIDHILWQRLFRTALIAMGGLFLLAVLAIAVLRLAYPYELEWMEGGSLLTVARLLHGNSMYVEPTTDWVPFIYAPLFYWLAAGASRLLGEGFLALRLISLLATVGSLSLIFFFVRRRSGDWFWPLIGSALYAACFEIGGGWMDVGRVDSLHVFLLLLAAFVLDRRRDDIGHLIAAAIFVAAFLTKQSTVLALIPIAIWTLWTGTGRRRWLLPVASVVGMVISAAALHTMTDGWSTFYLFTLPASHELAPVMLVEFWRFDLLAPLPFALLALFALLLPTENPDERADRLWLLALAVGFLGSTYASRLHAGGWNNVLLPGYAVLAVILAIEAGTRFRRAGQNLKSILLLACLLQFALLIFDPRDHLPSVADRQAGDTLVTRLEAVEGEVWIPHHSYLAVRAGHTAQAQSMAVEDVLRGGDAELAAALDRRMREDIAGGRWSLILLDAPGFAEEMAGRYEAGGNPIADDQAFWPVTGLQTRPEFLYEKTISR